MRDRRHRRRSLKEWQDAFQPACAATRAEPVGPGASKGSATRSWPWFWYIKR